MYQLIHDLVFFQLYASLRIARNVDSTFFALCEQFGEAAVIDLPLTFVNETVGINSRLWAHIAW